MNGAEFAAELAATCAVLAGCGGSFVLGRRSATRTLSAPASIVPAPPIRIPYDTVPPEAILGREIRLADVTAARRWIVGGDVLVTGAGGSIGSELCRQIIAFNPRRLLLLGHGENSLFAIHAELIGRGFPRERLRIILADVADATRIRGLFARERPCIVFHAAAHKHVPICEDNVCEAIRNNVLGTRVLAMAAAGAGVAKFVMVSTDKAVNPTNVMGATKRIAEMICQSLELRSSTEFVSVRFGNVLGSRGSVIPVFARQIEAGGPVTITHRAMTRYFMTIPEAVSLVLVAGSTARDGNVCVLDMGEPVEIFAIAERLIRAMGRVPHSEIPIVEIGLRPGEKLYEELMTAEEGTSATAIDRLSIAHAQRVDYGAFGERLERLISCARRDQASTAVEALAELVPSFRPGEHWAAVLTNDSKGGFALA
jgi:FlaA1/EpsC-like NDP-sugar epimerase